MSERGIAQLPLAKMVGAGLAAGLRDASAPETALDDAALSLREKVYVSAGASFDALLELLESDKVPVRKRMRVHETVVKLVFKDINEVAKLRLERERLALEAETARLDRESRERQPGQAQQIIVRLDAEAVGRAELAAGEQERLRGARE